MDSNKEYVRIKEHLKWKCERNRMHGGDPIDVLIREIAQLQVDLFVVAEEVRARVKE